MRVSKTTAGVIAGMAATLTIAAHAHEGATGIVKERMDAMTESGKAMKAATESIRANRNLASIKDEALAISATAERITALFPPGSDQKPTDSKPEIWTHWDDFTARAAELKDESAKLAIAVDSRDPGSIGAQFRVVGKVCTGCHDLYRAKR
jgi:cytochrome c556